MGYVIELFMSASLNLFVRRLLHFTLQRWQTFLTLSIAEH
jgi:hypothetical protein